MSFESKTELENIKAVLNFIPTSYYDRYGILEKGNKIPHVSNIVTILTQLTQDNWKTGGNFQPVYNILGAEIGDKNFKGFFKEEKVGSIKNIYDLYNIKRENKFFYFETLKKIRESSLETICGYIDYINVNNPDEKIVLPTMFFTYTLLTNVSTDKRKIKKLYKEYFNYAYRNKEFFPEDAVLESFLNEKMLNKIFNDIDTDFEKIISIVKEKTKGFELDIDNHLAINRIFADIIMSADLEVIYSGKDNIFLGLKSLQNNQFEKLHFKEIISSNINYLSKKYDKSTYKEIFKIHQKIKNNQNLFKDKFILLVPKEESDSIRKIIKGENKFPDQEIVEQYVNIHKEKSTLELFFKKQEILNKNKTKKIYKGYNSIDR